MAALASLTDVRKRYGKDEVLRGITLTVEQGEWLALVGRSGSGKSTLLHVLSGLDRAYDGRVEVLGHDLGKLDDRALSRFRGETVGFVFQSFHLLDHLSVKENVALPAYFAANGPSSAAHSRAVDALARVGMVDHANKRPGELSGGQKQRVAIARALFGEPKLLAADEPTGNLDGETGAQLIELLHALHKGGLTIVVVTHEERVSQAAGRVLRLEDGRLAT
jgi:putative ABC transport system ATP-binding protein